MTFICNNFVFNHILIELTKKLKIANLLIKQSKITKYFTLLPSKLLDSANSSAGFAWCQAKPDELSQSTSINLTLLIYSGTFDGLFLDDGTSPLAHYIFNSSGTVSINGHYEYRRCVSQLFKQNLHVVCWR